MELAQVTRATVVIFMATGAVITFAGVWLMWRLRTHASTSKIDILGVKFESPSAGLLVFLVGAAFLSVPLFVDATPDEQISPSNDAIITDGATTIAKPDDSPEPSTLPPTNVPTSPGQPLAVTQGGKEVEPNDQFTSPNVIPIGAHIEGAAGKSPDWFRVDTPSNASDDLSIAVYGEVHASFRNQYGDVLFEKPDYRVSETFRAPLADGPYLVRISVRWGDEGYGITTARREPESKGVE